jgi:hypothetical protein
MGKKVKVLGTANDTGVPGVEFDLAKIVQNAKARGLKWTKEANYRAKNGRNINSADEAVYCCAVGAARLENDTTGINISFFANDNPSQFEHVDELNDSQIIGLGFRLAMRD